MYVQIGSKGTIANRCTTLFFSLYAMLVLVLYQANLVLPNLLYLTRCFFVFFAPALTYEKPTLGIYILARNPAPLWNNED